MVEATVRTDELQEQGSWVYLLMVCLVAALGGLLFGYDTAVVSGAIGFLVERFGFSPAWEGWAASCALVGCIIGVIVAGPLSDRLGRKKTLIVAAVLFFVSALGSAIPEMGTLGAAGMDRWLRHSFVVFRIIGGIGVGAASITSPMYIAEISPARIRGRMVSVNQFAIVSGMLVVYFVNYFIAGSHGPAWNVSEGWRWMFGSEMIPALLLLVLMFTVPESPRWLTERGRQGQALTVLARVDGRAYAKRELAEISSAIAQESGSLGQLLRPGMRLVLVIGVVLALLQQVTGINVFLYFAPAIFKQYASGTDAALLQTIVVGAVNLVFTVVAIWTVDRIGRKPLMMIGAAGMGLSLFALGLSAYCGRTAVWILAFVLGYIACFAVSVGPVTWVILSEIFPTRIRGRAMGVAAVCLWAANWVVSQTFRMMDRHEWFIETFHHAFPFWLYGAFCVVLVIFVWRVVPETKGKSLEEIEGMWMEPDSRTSKQKDSWRVE